MNKTNKEKYNELLSQYNNDVILSKYISRNERNNFSFEDLFPDYDKLSENLSLQKNGPRDYSAYNGYPEGHICKGCRCLKREDGYKFCGKFIPGMGTIGCSERWGCLNCRECPEGRNNTNNNNNNNNNDNAYTCENCKCHRTDAGYICGKVDRTNGYVHKCKSSCEKCDKCYGADSDDLMGDRGMVTVDPYTSLNHVILPDLESTIHNINNLL